MCSSTPGSGERIACSEDNASTSDIDIDAEGIDIDAVDNPGVRARHAGTGKIDITVGPSGTGDAQVRSDIDITGTVSGSQGAVDVVHSGTGNVDIHVRATDITNTQLPRGQGVSALHSGQGDLLITIDEETEIDSAIHGVIGSKQGSGDLEIRIQGGSRVSGGDFYGVRGVNSVTGGPYDSVVIVKDSTVNVSGFNDLAIQSQRELGSGTSRVTVRDSAIAAAGHQAIAVQGSHSGEGGIEILIENSRVTTEGYIAHPVYGKHSANGNVVIRVRNSVIRAESTDIHGSLRGTFSYGIFGRSDGVGNVDIDVRGGSITTKGTNSYGIFGRHQGSGDGDIDIRTSTGNAVTTSGPNAHGIVAENRAAANSGGITITMGGSVTVTGAGASGVRIGRVVGGNVDRAASIGEGGYRKHAVTIHGPVRGGSGADAAGVYLAGGGRVDIWSHGTLGADSGIAMLATGDTPGADPANDPTIKPKLSVNMNLNGRRVSQVLGKNWIVNDGGETSISVNGVLLHHGPTGVVVDGNGDPRKAPNGAFDVSIRLDGVTVDTSTDPWTISARSTSIVADRDFSAADFKESRKTSPPPPPPPMCPEGQVGTPPNCEMPPPPMCPEGQVGTPPNCEMPPPPMCPEGQAGTPPNCKMPPPPMCPEGQAGTPPNCEMPPPTIIEEYAPRAAVYEALPGFLLRLDAQGFSDERIASPGSPIWVMLSGGKGSYASERASVGAEFDFDRFTALAGLDIPLGENARGSISMRSVRGSAEVASSAGGGTIEAEGYGVALDGSWSGDDDWYARGRFSFTSHEVDLASSALGSLKKGVAARGRVLDIEAGKGMKLRGKTTLTPRARMTHSAIDVDPFTDAVGARFSLKDASHFTGGLGLAAATERDLDDGVLSLRGSMDLARTLGGARTSVDVSGERLYSESTRTRLIMGLGATYHRGRFSVGAELSAGGLGSGDTRQAGRVTFGMKL